MLINYIKLALRNFVKHKFHSFVNVLGLTIGITIVLLIVLFIRFEYSFDGFHNNADNLYRVNIASERNGEFRGESYVFVAPLAEAMYNDLPGINNYCRISTPRSSYLYSDNQPYKIAEIRFADSSFFNVFSFELVRGNSDECLTEPHSIVLSEKEALRIFGRKNAIGETLLLDNKSPYKVTGIVKDIPANSHIKFNALVSFSTLYNEPGHYMDWNGGNQYIHFVLLNKETTSNNIEAKMPEFMYKYINKDLEDIGIKLSAELHSFTDLHLKYNNYSANLNNNIAIFSVTAVLILLIACVNFINFSTAKSIKRAKEIGIRKALGAHRSKLIYQFLSETLLLTTAAVIISLILVELLLPGFRNLVGEQIPPLNLFDMTYLLCILIIIPVTGLLAGFYPAFHLTKFEAVKVLHGSAVSGRSKTTFRNALILVQYTVAVVLIIGTVFVIKQLKLIKEYNTGYNKDNILILNLSTEELQHKSILLKKQLLGLPEVNNVSAASDIPYKGFESNGYFPEGYTEPLMINVVHVDSDFFNTFDLRLTEGTNFPSTSAGTPSDYIVNEKFVSAMGWESALGKTVRRNGLHQIRGVVKDFNFASLYNSIKPLIITAQPYRGRFDYLAVKMNMANTSKTVEQIESIWNKAVPNNPFEYWFLNDAFNQVYKTEQKFKQGFGILASVAILISLLGLTGLISFTTEQRIKEIGIRKILGATGMDIIKSLTKTYLIILCFAVVAAWSISYYFVDIWLQQFAYKIDQSIWIYLLSGLAALLLSAISVTAVVTKSVNSNPVESLKYE